MKIGFIDKYLDKYEVSKRNGIIYGEDPYKYFIGNPRSGGGYGCFSPVIENAIMKIAGSDAVHNLGGRNIDFIIESYVSKGIPVVIGEFGAGRVLLKPAAPGTGVIAGGPVRAVVEMVGIKDIRSKALRSNNPCNVVRATVDGLSKLRNAEEVAAIRGKSVKEITE